MALSTPYSHNFSKPLQANDKIAIDAFFKDDGNTFTVMLLCDGDKEMTNALLILEIDWLVEIKVSFRKNGVKGVGKMVPECHTIRGQELKLLIEANSEHFKIILNGYFTAIFVYMFPLNMVKYIWIDGDINLTMVTLPD